MFLTWFIFVLTLRIKGEERHKYEQEEYANEKKPNIA